MENLSIELREMARGAGLCDHWYKEWGESESTESLFDKYKRGIDFSIGKEWISNDFIKSHWDKKTLQDNNIYVDDKEIVKYSPKGVVVINGESEITLDFGFFDTADIYLRHKSKLVVRAYHLAKIMVNMYDDTELTINCSEKAKVYVYRHTTFGILNDIGDNPPIVRYEQK